jgi:Na+-transporting methylmalonyl-CoA/oxaloacetate decarboxylase gamma subunit
MDPILKDAAWLSVLNMGVVMTVFALLYLVIMLVRWLVGLLESRRLRPAPAAVLAPGPASGAGPGDEEVAVIGAAVAACLGHDRFRILSVSEVLPWARTGRAEIMAGRQAVQRAVRR